MLSRRKNEEVDKRSRDAPKDVAMSRSDFRTLIDRARRAGLKTSEMYPAISTRPLDAPQLFLGRTDTNGFVSGYDVRGHQVYHPCGNNSRS